MSTSAPDRPDGAPSPGVRVAADFAAGADYPLIKGKFALFNSGIVPVATYERDADLFPVVAPESLRIDLGWGTEWAEWTRQPIGGTAAAPVYDLAELDRIAEILNERGVLPYWSYCYTPSPLQDPPGDWKSVPGDWAAWGKICGDIAAHYRALGPANPMGYHEVYNEPDNEYFTNGGLDDYLAMYDAGVKGIRAADPEALVGGPALAFTREWIVPFVDFVAERGLPLDFFSTHVYGTEDGYARLGAMLDASREALDRHPAFATTEIHLNEFNSYPIDYPIDGTQQKHRLAAAFLRDMAYLLARPEVTLVHWAQFLDSGQDNYSGMVSIDGHRKAVFNAAEIYARLPVDRVRVDVAGPSGVGGMAGVDAEAGRAGLVVWNMAAEAHTVAVHLDGVPFAAGTLRVYRIDAGHASWGDGAGEALAPVETREGVDCAAVAWEGEIPGGGVVYLELDAGGGESASTPRPTARWLRTLRYYPDRTTTAYADFDKTTWVAHLGMGSEATADARAGVTAEDWPETLGVAVTVNGSLTRVDAESLLGVRVDYDADGGYASGVLFHGPYRGVELFDPAGDGAMPWGTGRAPDRTVRVPDLAGFEIPVRALAPVGWDGRAQVTALLRNGGAGTRAKIVLRAAGNGDAGDRRGGS